MPVPGAELTSLSASHDIISLGILADEVRRRRCGTRTTFVRVADVPLEPQEPVTVPPAAGEIRIVGTPSSLEGTLARVSEVAASAGRVPLSGFSLAELEELSAREGLPLRSVLEELRGAGLELVAEAPFDRLKDPRRSIEQVNIAGLTLARLTIHQATTADPLTVLQGVADLQHAVAVIRAFAPLPRKVNPALPTTGFDDVKRVSLARLCLEDIPSIQVDWALYGPKLAQVALTMGADDIDGVSPLGETGQGPRRSPLEEVLRNVRAAGLDPVERDGRFDLITR